MQACDGMGMLVYDCMIVDLLVYKCVIGLVCQSTSVLLFCCIYDCVGVLSLMCAIVLVC